MSGNAMLHRKNRIRKCDIALAQSPRKFEAESMLQNKH